VADQPDVLKRLESIEKWSCAVSGRYCTPETHDPGEYDDCAVTFLLRLTRALLESQWELMERVGNQECKCPSIAGSCRRCKVLTRAERVRRGEV
jgi:hypothetical protein